MWNMRAVYAENKTFDGFFGTRPTPLISEAYQPRWFRPEDRPGFSYVAGAMLDVHGADTVTAPLI
jgi:hypothetical protein